MDIKDLILDWIPGRRSKGADIIQRFTFFFLCSLDQQYIMYVIIHESSTLFSCLYLYCFITCKVFLTWTSLIDREPNIKMQVLQILENKKTTTTKIRVDLIMQIGYRWIFWENLDREKIGKNSRKSRQFVL